MRWPAALRPVIDVCAIQLPGRERRSRERSFTHIEPLLHALTEALEPELDLPFAFFGHSMGSLVAFALAQRWKRLGRPEPFALIASGGLPPFEREDRRFGAMSDEALVAWLRALGGTPEEVLAHAELLELILPVVRADLSIIDSYRHDASVKLSCPIHAFGGSRDPGVPVTALAGWSEVTTGAFHQRVFEGGHHFLGPSWHAVTVELRTRLMDVPVAARSASETSASAHAQSAPPSEG